MVESGCRTSLATKTFQGLGIVSYFFRQELQSHESAKARVLGFVDNTHAAAAELLNDAVVRDGLADHAQACYGGSLGKSMKAMEFAASQKSCWRNIASLTMSAVSSTIRAHSGMHSEKSAISLSWKNCRSNQGSLVIVSGQELSPTHASLRSQP